LVFGGKKSYFLGILKVWDPFVNHMSKTLKGFILNIKWIGH
jgi:hypothetical protein